MEKIFNNLNNLLRHILSLSLFLFWATASAKEILTISEPQELTSYLKNHITKDTLLVLDIDDTLLIANEVVLRAKQLDLLLNELKIRLNLNQNETLGFLEFCLETSNHRLGKGQLLFPEWPLLVEECFNRSAKVIALTNVMSGIKTIRIPKLGIQYTQSKKGEDRRLEDLEAVGLSFERSFQKELGAESREFPQFRFSFSSHPPPLFKKGIICTNLHPKGEALSAFLLGTFWKPSKVIFVDNVLEHLISVDEKIGELSIPFQGIHFTYVETHLSELEPFLFVSQLNSLIYKRQFMSLSE